MGLRQLETKEVVIGEITYYIRPFGAFQAANLTGELAAVLAPIFGAIVPLAAGISGEQGLLDVDAGKAAEAIANCTSLNGDKLEKLIRKLLLGGHISLEIEDEEGRKEAQRLDLELADEIFCGEVQDMFLLCFYVIQINFNGFFKKFANQSGKDGLAVGKIRPVI